MGKKGFLMLFLSLLLAGLVAAIGGCQGASGGSGGNAPELVAIEVTPANSSIAINTVQQFAATGIYSDNSTKDLTSTVEWSSSDPAVAVVGSGTGTAGAQIPAGSLNAALESAMNTPGHVYAMSEGTATIKASWGKLWGSSNLSVKRSSLVSIRVTPANSSSAKGATLQFTAMGTFDDNTTQDITKAVVWNSSDMAVATISSRAGSNGLASTIAAGTTTITAASGAIRGSTILTVNPSTLISIAVTPAGSSIAKGTNQQFAATGTYSDNTTQNLTNSVNWTSSNTSVATISNAAGSKGLAKSVSAGSTAITAVSGDISGSASLTVNAATLASIAVTPANTSITSGTKRQFIATGTYSDNTTQNLTNAVTWSSSGTGVATISNAAGSNGLATAAGAGTTTIKAISGTVSGMTTLTVTAPATSVTLTWDASTTNTDGTALTDLAGYKVYYGTSPGNYTATINAGNVTTYMVSGLAPGTYYFAVTAVNSGGAESGYSNEAGKAIQ